MKVLGEPIIDSRIGCKNFLLEMSMNEYYSIAQNILKNRRIRQTLWG